ncbi:protein Z-dependent protease inhibitor [Oryzias melastigma]|uniref:Protein Z-dependent protease inhibitor-like n=1 Tax=Oryzias melastigma TaxID=30732 RepID=A0A3B3CTP0_ORYME|nr:protein Z-dependent protease inhibitor [Oryzias melastigma]
MVIHRIKMQIFALLCFIVPVHSSQLPNATIMDLSYKNMDFAMNLYREIANYHDKNIFYSPLSVSTSFAALLMATDGITHKEILKVCNLEQLEVDDQPQLIPRLFQNLQDNITHNGSLQVEQSMALFIRQHFEVEKTFEDDLKNFFQADINVLDFGNTKETIKSINDYVRQKTADKVPEMISSLNAMTQLLLINTIFFQGAWQTPFNPNFTDNAPFHIDNYNIVQVPMMFVEGRFYTMEDEPLGARVLKLPYKGGVSMLILLPNENTDYTMIDDEISAAMFLNWISKLEKRKLEVRMPRFRLEQSYLLHNILPNMGLKSLFTDSADLTKLSKNEDLTLSEVLHKAVIEVDEVGTTAAASTAAHITTHSLSMQFRINRPFFCFIYHEETTSLLFMGRVINPTKN